MESFPKLQPSVISCTLQKGPISRENFESIYPIKQSKLGLHIYRWFRYFESKVLRNTEITQFLTAQRFLQYIGSLLHRM